MKCISIWQPWASLLFSPGAYRKVYETRPLIACGKNGWKRRPSIVLQPGEIVAIQAAKSRQGFALVDGMRDRFNHDAIIVSLQKQFGVFSWDDLPRGQVIGLVTIGATVKAAEIRRLVDDCERAFGNWSDDRVAITTNKPLKITPFDVVGKQGVFQIDEGLLTSIDSVREYLGASK